MVSPRLILLVNDRASVISVLKQDGKITFDWDEEPESSANESSVQQTNFKDCLNWEFR